jgi:hypothetical protein
MIPAPAGKPEENASRERGSQTDDRPSGDKEPERPKARRRTPQMPGLAELVDQLQQVSGLVTLGILTPAKANVVVRCISKSSDIVMRSQAGGPQSVSNQADLVEACRENPKLLHLLEGLLTDDQLAELMRDVTGDDA